MTNIILCGVGGQGTVLASKLIAMAAIQRGESAHTAETIGMAQRGGSVVSHVRIGENSFSPLIPLGSADMIIAFEPAEAVRNLPYLKPNGTIIVNSAPVKPVTDALSDTSYDCNTMLDYLKKQEVDLFIIDGNSIIAELGSAKSLNVALLSAACKTGKLGFNVAEITEAIKNFVKPAFLSQNIKAVELGAKAINT